MSFKECSWISAEILATPSLFAIFNFQTPQIIHEHVVLHAAK